VCACLGCMLDHSRHTKCVTSGCDAWLQARLFVVSTGFNRSAFSCQYSLQDHGPTVQRMYTARADKCAASVVHRTFAAQRSTDASSN
jgi:hypothetical protein